MKDYINRTGHLYSFIPQPLDINGKPEYSVFPFNVLIARYKTKDNKLIMGSVIYEPDLSSLIIDKEKNLIMNYYNCYNRRYYLKMIVEKDLKSRRCEKYCEAEKIGATDGVIDWEKQEESWHKFFQHVGLLGLTEGETCQFKEVSKKA